MGPWEWFVIFAVCGLIATAAWHWNRSDDSRTYRGAWEESTTTRRTEADVRRDLADAKARLEIAELYEIWPDPPRSARQIPHQTRRTEDNQ